MIKYFWALQSDNAAEIDHKLLPVGNTDFILNLSRPITYTTGEKSSITCKGFHFNGLHERYYNIKQTGILNVVGISFFNAGAYPVLKAPMDIFTDKTMELSYFLKDTARRIEEILYAGNINNNTISKIENEIIRSIDAEFIPPKSVLSLIDRFFTHEAGINAFCEKYGVNPRTLERIIKQYIGMSPKQCQRINRFQTALKMICARQQNLTRITYDNNYFDQSHLIKDFKYFTGCTPTEFLEQKNSIIQIIQS